MALTFALLNGAANATTSSSLCPNGSELISTQIELYDAAGALIHKTGSTDRKICRTYPADGGFTWEGFSELYTTQFVLPHRFVGRGVATIRLVGPSMGKFLTYYQDTAWSSVLGSVNVSYPPKGGAPGDPAHLSLFPNGGNGARVQAVWVSFSQAAS